LEKGNYILIKKLDFKCCLKNKKNSQIKKNLKILKIKNLTNKPFKYKISEFMIILRIVKLHLKNSNKSKFEISNFEI